MEVIRSARSRLRLLACLLAISLAGATALLIGPSSASAAATVTDLGEGFPISINSSDHVLIGRLTFEGEPEEEDLAEPFSIWADGKSTPLAPLNGEGDGEEEGSFRHELELEQINDAGEAAGTSTVNVVFGEGESSEDRPVIYSPSGVGREVALFQDTITDDEDEQIPVGGLGIGIDDKGDAVGIGVQQIGGKVRGRGFFAPAGGSPEVVGEADAPEDALWFSEIFEVNASGTMFGQLTTTEENEEEEEIPTGTKYYLWNTPSSPGIQLNFDELVRGLANDGTVLGGRGGTLFMRTPDGKEVAVDGLDKPEAVNSAHQIVGSEIVKGAEHAAVWQSGKVTDLNTLLPENSGWVLQRAATINDAGDIAGIGLHQGHSSAFLMPAVKTSEELEVTSVEDTTTGLDSGSILGGDTLKIKGSGFEVPEGEDEVELFLDGKSISSGVVTPISDSEIQVISPDLSALQSQVPDGADGLATDVRVKITAVEGGKRHETISPSSLDGTGPDRFDAVVPTVTSVTDEESGNDRGSILGGDTLKIKGSGFGAPQGGKTMVAFSLGGEQLGKSEASTVSAKEVTVQAPDLASFASKIPADKEGLPLDVTVITSSGTKEVHSKTVSGDAFEALLPKVDSVEDTDTKESIGSVLGGETLAIKGSGFNVPVGGSAAVRFYLGGDLVKTVDVQQDESGESGEGVSPGEILLTAPDLASLQSQIKEGDAGLSLDVVVQIKDAGGDEVLSPSALNGDENEPDNFVATIPVITSVTDETTKKPDGSILGGDTLKIKGFSFNAPAGASIVVKFNLGDDTVKTVPIRKTTGCEEGCEDDIAPETSTEVTVETPNLANLAKQIPADKEGLPLNLTVEIKTKTDAVESKSTFDGKGEDAFEALLPRVDSVEDTDTKEPIGSILGSETLAIKGSGFNVPVGGSAAVVFYLGGDPVKTVPVEADETGESGQGIAPDEIQVTAPDLSSLQNQIKDGDLGLHLDVVVQIKDAGGDEVLSPSALNGKETEPDAFFATIPVIFSVTDETTKKPNGSILGGDTLKIKGASFNAPPGASIAVKFNLGEDTVKTVPVKTEDTSGECGEGCEGEGETVKQTSTELTVETPNLASLAKQIPADKEGLPLNLTVEIKTKTSEVESTSSLDGKGEDAFEALLPKVDAVEDTDTKESIGSILGGETLAIKGSGFNVPVGGSAAVRFYLGGDLVKTVDVQQDETGESGEGVSPSEIFVTAPDLASLQGQIKDGNAGLSLDVVVQIKDAGGDEVLSPSALNGDENEPDNFVATIPVITSVTDETTKKPDGSILGGDTLKIKGFSFNAPAGATVSVKFNLGDDTVKTVPVKTEDTSGECGEGCEGEGETVKQTSTEVTVETPNLANLAKQIPEGKEGLPLNLTVEIKTETDEVESKSTFDGKGEDAFEALLPKVTSVEDVETKEPLGSILGGETLAIKGSGFNVPVGGSAAVRFYLGGDQVKTVEIQQDETGEGGNGFASPDEIQVTAPDLASLQDQIKEGQAGLPLDVVVVIKDAGGDEVLSPSNLTAKEDDPDFFLATIPVVFSVTDETTKKPNGSILGGDTLKIKGASFNAPEGATIAVKFHLGEDVVKTVLVNKTTGCEEGCEGEETQAAPQTSTELNVETPNLANLAKQIPEGKEGLPLNLTVEIKTKTDTVESLSSLDGKGEDAFEALLPKVDSVEDVETKEPVGSILGGETLAIKGSGFNVPVGGSASVRFYLGGDLVKTVEVQQDETGESGEGVSPSEIFVTAPDLASLQDQLKEGRAGLPLDVVVQIKDAGGDEVLSPSNLTAKEGDPDLFIATIPVITSVTDETTKKPDGSILGGDTLKIKGFSFNAPAGATVSVKFNLGDDTVKTVPVKTEECGEGCEGEGETVKQTSTEVTVETPNLANLAKQIPEGKEGLPLNLTVEIKTKTDEVESLSTLDGKGEDAFEALLPKVTSVEDTDTKESVGSILGGETLAIKGSGFNVPVGGSAGVRFYLGGDLVKTVEVQQDESGESGEGVSPSEILLTAPDLSGLQKQIPEGQTKLVVDVRVVFLDKEGNEVESPITSADRFTLDTLGVTSANATTFTVGDPGTFAVTAQGAKPITLKETGALPEGVSFDETGDGTAELAGTPAEGSAGVYPLTITASNGTDPDATQNFTLKVQDVPGAPENVTASAGMDSADVTWTAPSSDGESDIKSYVVTANPGGESATVSGTASSAVIDGLTAGTEYTFSVSAVNAVGEGQPGTSNSVVVTSTELEHEQEATSTEPDGSASTEPVSSPDGSTLTATGEGEGTLHVGTYSSDPVALLSDGTSYFDVATSTGSKFTSVNFKICGVEAGASVQWWDPTNHTWQAASSQTAPTGEPPCVTVTVDATTSPSLSDLDGTVFAVTAPGKSGEEETPVTHETPKTPEGGTTSTGTTTSSSGVAGFTTKSIPEISLAGPAKVKAGSVRVPLQCGPGSGQCARLTLQLTVTEHLHDHRVSAITAGGKTRELVIGQLKVTLSAGQSKIVTVSLNSAGRRLLKSHRRFKASLRVSAGHAIVKEQIVTIVRRAKG